MAPPPKRKEEKKKKKKKRQSEQWSDAVPQGHSRDQEWGPSLPLPISPVFYIEYPCNIMTGILTCQLCTQDIVFSASLSYLTYFLFGSQKMEAHLGDGDIPL